MDTPAPGVRTGTGIGTDATRPGSDVSRPGDPNRPADRSLKCSQRPLTIAAERVRQAASSSGASGVSKVEAASEGRAPVPPVRGEGRGDGPLSMP